MTGVYGDDRKRKKVVTVPEYNFLTHKWCNRCESVKELSGFGNDKSTKDGLCSNCKACKTDQKQKSKENKASLPAPSV